MTLSAPPQLASLVFSPEELDEVKAPGRILSLELELSRACNLRCTYCYASSGEALQDELSQSEILTAITNASLLGARNISILGGGEPLLYPGLKNILDHILSRGLRTIIFTNGTLLDGAWADYFTRQRIPVVIKLNSLDAHVQDALVQQPGTAAQIKQAFQLMMDRGAHRQGLLGAETIICQQNLNNIPDIWRFCRENTIIPYVEVLTDQGRASLHNLSVSPRELQTLFHALLHLDQSQYGFTWRPHPPIAAQRCNRHDYSVVLTSTGEIYPCTGINLPIGNIRQQDLQQILTNSAVLRDLKTLPNSLKGPCRECELTDECYGCRGHAYQTSGDYLGTDTSCWRHSSC